MRDQTIMEELNRMKKYIQMLENSVRLAFTGQELRGASLQSLLIKKGTITEEEMNTEIGATITKMQAQAEEAAKKQATEIIKPTDAQVQQVVNAPVPEVPPQV